MTRPEILKLLERHQQSFASRNPVAIAADHTPDGTFYSQAAGLARGREAIEGVYAYWLGAFPDMEFTWGDPVIEGDRAAIFWHFRGTLTGDFFGHAKTGSRVEFDGAADYRLAPEGIVSATHIFDFTGALVSAGVMKVKPGD
jgi:predicted ester cyclase